MSVPNVQVYPLSCLLEKYDFKKNRRNGKANKLAHLPNTNSFPQLFKLFIT